MSHEQAIQRETAVPGGPSSPRAGLAAGWRGNAPAWIALGTAYALCFWPTLAGLVSSWRDDPDLSHGFLIPAIAAVLFLRRGESAGALEARPSSWGLVPFAGSLLLFFAGRLSHTNTIERLAAWGALVGAVWTLLGTRVLRARAFPLAFLLLAIPPPHFLLNSLRLELKGLATRLSADALSLLGVPALPEGNVLALDGHRLEVADACSGIRSLLAIIATAILFAHLFRSGWWKGSLLVAAAIPVTVLVNVVRIALIAWALVAFDVDLTSGTSHEVVGYAVFVLSLGLLYASWILIDWLCRWRRKESVS